MDLYNVINLFFDLLNKDRIEIIFAFLLSITIGFIIYNNKNKNNREELIDEIKKIEHELIELKYNIEKINEQIINKCNTNIKEVNEMVEDIKINITILSEKLSYLLELLIIKFKN